MAGTPVVVNSAVTASEQDLMAQFYKAGLIPSAPNMSGFVTTQFNSSVSGG
jgi:hypothetical protein